MPEGMGTTLVVGAGPGLGAALAQRFSEAGAAVAVAARSHATIDPIAAAIERAGGRAICVPYDTADEHAVAAGIAQVEKSLGPITTLLYNAGNMVRGSVEELSAEEFMSALLVGPYGAFLHTRILLPAMAGRGGGTVILTGATSSMRSPAHSPAFGAAKFGLRGLAMSLSRTWAARGVHIAHVLVDGVIRTPRSRSYLPEGEPALEPRDIAEAYFQISAQPRSAWTFEMDLRPAGDDYLDN